LPGTARPFAVNRSAVVVKLKGDADHVIALLMQKRGGDRRIHAARHGDHDPRVLRASFESKAI
jgi:hypothetical protein